MVRLCCECILDESVAPALMRFINMYAELLYLQVNLYYINKELRLLCTLEHKNLGLWTHNFRRKLPCFPVRVAYVDILSRCKILVAKTKVRF